MSRPPVMCLPAIHITPPYHVVMSPCHAIVSRPLLTSRHSDMSRSRVMASCHGLLSRPLVTS
eukprot:269913-Amorphochlora_amoeboformis.AAC.1